MEMDKNDKSGQLMLNGESIRFTLNASRMSSGMCGPNKNEPKLLFTVD